MQKHQGTTALKAKDKDKVKVKVQEAASIATPTPAVASVSVSTPGSGDATEADDGGTGTTTGKVTTPPAASEAVVRKGGVSPVKLKTRASLTNMSFVPPESVLNLNLGESESVREGSFSFPSFVLIDLN